MKKYLLLIDQINAINRQFSLKPNEIELLNVLAKSHLENRSMMVSDLIQNRAIASPATLHATLKSLIRKKLVIAKADHQDGRRKEVGLTKRALDHYMALNGVVIN